MTSDFSLAGRVRDQASDSGSLLTNAVDALAKDLATFDQVEERLVEAWGYLMRMPDRELGLHRLKASWPDIRRHNAFGDYGDMESDAAPKAPGLRTAEVDAMEEALGWVEWVKGRDRKLIGVVLAQLQRAARPEWPFVALALDRSVEPDAYRKRYSRAITLICNRLNAAENREVEGVNG